MVDALQEQLTLSRKAGVNTLVDLARTALWSTERLAELQMVTLRALVDTTANQVAAPWPANGQAAEGRPPVTVGPLMETLLNYSRAVYELSRDTHIAYSETYRTQRTAAHKNLNAALEGRLKTAPVGTDVALLALKSVIAAADHAFDSVHLTTRQILVAEPAAAAESPVAAANPAPVAQPRRKKAA